jgi:hypothetical protein
MKYISEVISTHPLLKEIENYSRQDPIEVLIMRNWINIVPKKKATRCSPVVIKNNDTLVIKASTSTVRNELMFGKRGIEKQLKEVTKGVVKKIEIKS